MLVWCPNWIICMIENYLRFLSHAIRLYQLLQSRKGESLIVPKKVETFCFGMLVNKLAHTHRFEHEPSGLKASILPLDNGRLNCASCKLKRELSRGKKAPALSHNTCLSQV